MMASQTSEEVWAGLVNSLPRWCPSSAPIMLVAPHPDDEVLGVGGLVATQRLLGRDVFVVAVTDGEHAYPDDPNSVQSGILRCAEQTAALQRLGVPEENIFRVRLPDSAVTSHLPQLIERLSCLVSNETHILAPWRGDFHPDHEACGLAAEEVARTTGAILTSYFFWTWHRGTPELLKDLRLRSFPLSRQVLRAKTAALLCHRSQLVRDQGSPILPDSLLGPARRPFEVFLVQ